MSDEQRALTGIELFDVVATYPGSRVVVSFAGLHMEISEARYYAAGDEIVLQVGSEWFPAEWQALERPEGHRDQERPQADPGEP